MTRRLPRAMVLAAAALGCAQASSPPGGQPDRTPPRVVSVFPLPFDTLTDLAAPVVITFDERLSERLEGVAEFEDAVLVSPATGDVDVDRDGGTLEISIDGGWKACLVYRVVVLPLFRDLFSNARVEPVELVFSTGAPIPPTAVAGLIEDRLTGAVVRGGRVEATRRTDSIVYVAVSDTGGFFSLRNIPEGTYDVRAWLDRDRDEEADFEEAQDAETVPLGVRDTAILAMTILPRDTMPAQLIRAEPVDSLRVRLHFDDYFEPGPVAGRAAVFRLPDTTYVTEGPLVHSTTLDSILARERAVADSLRAIAEAQRRAREDSIRQAAMDSLAPPGLAPPGLARADTMGGDTAVDRPTGSRPAARERPSGQRRAPPDRPSRELVAILPLALVPEITYLIEVSGVVNIRGLPGGGGTAVFTMPARPDTLSP